MVFRQITSLAVNHSQPVPISRLFADRFFYFAEKSPLTDTKKPRLN